MSFQTYSYHMDSLPRTKMESISELNETNIKKVCRTCLTINTEEMISIYEEIEQLGIDENVKIYICDMLMDVALIELNRKENLPKLICINCLRLVQLLSNFRKQCNRSQTILLEYLAAKEDKVIGKLGTEKEKLEQSVNEYEHESVTIEDEVRKLSNPSSSCDLLNATIKLEFDDEIIKPDIESETERDDVIGTSGTEKSPNQDNNVKKKKSTIKKELINTEKISNENKTESIPIKVDIQELSNPSSSDNLLNNIKLDPMNEITISDTKNERKVALHSKENYNKAENILTCKLCDKAFETDTLLFSHMKEHPEDNILCNICSKHFKTRRNLIAHMQQHSEDKCVCEVCNKRFKHHKNLTAHMYTHKDEKRYSCKVCGKGYKQSGSLVIHMRMHTGPKSFLCSVCGKGFWEAPSLKVHMRTHTKEKPYMCNICGLTMAVQCHLKQHMRTHTDERPFKCTECNKAFRSSAQLKRHSLIHTGLKPYSCDVCKKSFNRQSTLRLHEKIHKNERPHVCQLCGKSFIQAHCLRTHLQNHK